MPGLAINMPGLAINMPKLAINTPGNRKELKNHLFPVCPVRHLCCWRIAAGRYFLPASLFAPSRNANI
jgi:hypothetical protein